MPLVEIKQKDQEGLIPWALKGAEVDPGSPEAKGKEPQAGIRTSEVGWPFSSAARPSLNLEQNLAL